MLLYLSLLQVPASRCRPRLKGQQNVKRDTPPCPQPSPSPVSFPGFLSGPDPYSDPSRQGWAWTWGRVEGERYRKDWKETERERGEGLFYLLL